MIRLFVAGLVLKLLATVARYLIIFYVYDGSSDVPRYVEAGASIAGQLRSGSIPEQATATGTEFLEFIVGVLFAVTGVNQILGFAVLSLVGFVGLWLFLQAFVLAVPEGNHVRYGVLVLLLPTLLFWTSSIGKEAVITFGLGVAAYGAARVYRRLRFGYLVMAPGLLLTFMVRPHMAALFVAAFAAGFLLRPAAEGQERALPQWAAGVLVATVAATVLVGTLDDQLPVEADSGGNIFTQVTSVTEDRTSQGGSAFTNRPVEGLSDIPAALVTVPFRPFPWEVLGNPQAVITGLEGLGLLLLVVVAVARGRVRPRTVLRTPLAVMAGAYSLGFCIAFSSIGNFGILARQRAQLLPFLLVLLCLSRAGSGSRSRSLRSPDPAEAPAALPASRTTRLLLVDAEAPSDGDVLADPTRDDAAVRPLRLG